MYPPPAAQKSEPSCRKNPQCPVQSSLQGHFAAGCKHVLTCNLIHADVATESLHASRPAVCRGGGIIGPALAFLST